MLRITAIAFLLFAYLIGVGYCGISGACCVNGPDQNHAEHADDGHTSHANECQLEKGLPPSFDLINLGKLLAAAGALLFCVLLFVCVRTLIAVPLLARQTHERLVLLACRWQFMTRSAGLARAPALLA